MSKTKRRYSWDTSVFLAYLNNESGAPLAVMAEILHEVEQDKAIMVVSVIVVTEILQAKHSKEQYEAFRKLLNRSSVEVIDLTLGLSEKVEAIRSAAVEAGHSIRTPDATIIATAIVHKADELHTLEGQKGMRALHGSALVDGLRITEPRDISGQGLLEFAE